MAEEEGTQYNNAHVRERAV